MRGLEVRSAILVLRGVRIPPVGLWIGILLCVIPGRAASDAAEHPAPPSSRWVADTIGVLNDADRAAINRLGDAIHAADPQAALFVLAIESTGGSNARRFATDQLNRHGPRGTLRRGVLVLLARQDRAAELVLGDDLLRRHGTTASDRIMRDTIVAAMRRNDPRGALVGSARECARAYFGITADADGRIAGTLRAAATPSPATAASDSSTRADSLDLERSAPSPTDAVAQPRPEPANGGGTAQRVPRRSTGVTGTAIAGVLAMIGILAAGLLAVIRGLGPRKCPQCNQPMQELPAADEAPHLSPSERTEERVGSVDYRIWQCAPCGRFEKTRHGKWFSGFSGCPKCHAETKREMKQTLRAATTVSTGLVEITEHCEHCGHHHVFTRTLPCLPPPSRSSGGIGRGGGFGGGGGRSSSGGGSSGKW